MKINGFGAYTWQGFYNGEQCRFYCAATNKSKLASLIGKKVSELNGLKMLEPAHRFYVAVHSFPSYVYRSPILASDWNDVIEVNSMDFHKIS